MTVCIKCHRPLKRASVDGYGPVCRKTIAPVASGERDLFGFDIAAAVQAARARLEVQIRGMVIEAHIANRRAFRRARVLLGVWAK